ncbi:protein FAM118A-like [Pleurodeles waltl]|uniref:protein FAM118A-like n=1 Tax=Pleurodeles waltl TaxID=8319 RepID=UPI0037097D79
MCVFCCREKFHILKYKQPRNMVLVVGTGVSAAAAPGIDALKSWRHCLLAIIDAAKELQVLHPSEICEFRREVCARKDLLTVAHQIRRHMSPLSGEPKPTFFQDCLIKIFEDLEDHVCCPDVLQSILKVMEKGALVVTTNYDTFLETFGRHLRRPMQSLDMQDPAKVLAWARGLIRFGVLHLHGVYWDPSGILNEPAEYKEAVTKNSQLLQTLQDLYCKKSFLFLGCGETLRRHLFKTLFCYSDENKCDFDHYMLVAKKDDDTFYRRQRDLLWLGIKLITYGDDFAQFPQYLQDVSTLICKEETPEQRKDISSRCEWSKGRTSAFGVAGAEEEPHFLMLLEQRKDMSSPCHWSKGTFFARYLNGAEEGHEISMLLEQRKNARSRLERRKGRALSLDMNGAEEDHHLSM